MDVLLAGDTLQGGDDAHVLGQLADGLHGGGAVLGLGHAVHALDTHGAGDLAVLLSRSLGVVGHDGGQEGGAGLTVRHIVVSGKGVCHGVVHAQTHVGEAHTGHVLAQSHALAALGGVGHGPAQGGGDDADSLDVEHIRQSPGTLGDVALNGVGQSVHTRGGGEGSGHGGHHVGIHHGDDRDIVGVHANELALLLHVGDDVVDGDLGGGAGGGGDGDDGHAGVLGGSYTLQRTNVGELGVGDDDADGLGGVHGRAAADGHDAISLGCLEGRDTALDVLDGGVGLDVREDGVGDGGGIQKVGDLGGHTELDEVGVGGDEGLGKAAGLDLIDNGGDGTRAVVGGLVEHELVHSDISFL